MDWLTKLSIGAVIFLLLVIVGLTYRIQYLSNQNTILEQQNVLLDQILKDEQEKAQRAISEANERIAQYEIDKKSYEAKISHKTENIDKETKKEEVRIVYELQKDSSSENQLKLVEGMLHDFASKR